MKDDVPVGDFFHLYFRELSSNPQDIWQTYDDSISLDIQAAPRPVVKPVEDIDLQSEKVDIMPEVIKPETDSEDTSVPKPEVIIDIPK